MAICRGATTCSSAKKNKDDAAPTLLQRPTKVYRAASATPAKNLQTRPITLRPACGGEVAGKGKVVSFGAARLDVRERRYSETLGDNRRCTTGMRPLPTRPRRANEESKPMDFRSKPAFFSGPARSTNEERGALRCSRVALANFKAAAPNDNRDSSSKCD